MNDCIKRWTAAEELYFALTNNAPAEQLEEKIATYMDFTRSLLPEMQAIYNISMAVSNEDTFNNVYRNLKMYGLNYGFFQDSIDFYFVYKLCSKNDAEKRIAYSLKYKVNLFRIMTPLVLIAIIRNCPVEKLSEILEPYNKFNMDDCQIDEYIYYLSATGQTDLLFKICRSSGIGLVAALNIAIENPDFFYGTLKEKYFDNLPPIFKHENELYTIEELIPLMFRSDFISRHTAYNIGYVDVAERLFRYIIPDNIDKIISCFPKVKSLRVIDIDYLMQNTDVNMELFKTVVSKIGRKITLTGGVPFNDDNGNIKEFCDSYLNCKIQINHILLRSLIQNNSNLLEYFIAKGARFKISPARRASLVKDTIIYNNTDSVNKLIKASLITPDLLEDAISYAVTNHSLKALDILNRNYDNIINRTQRGKHQ